MRKMKGFATVLLTVVLVVVSACSQNSGEGSEGTNDNKATNAPVAETAAPTEAPPAVEEPVIDMNGETLKIIHWIDGPSEETPEGALAIAKWKEAEEKYNVKIVWEKVPWGENIKMVTNAALSGESVADIVPLDYYFAIPAINQGLFMPVDDFFDFNDPKWPAGLKQHGMVNGKMYGFTSNINNASGIYYNKTLFEREGLPDPHELIAQDKWNWDAFLDIAKRATKDTNGDGVIDQWGLTNIASNLSRILIHSNDSAIIQQKDGKHVYAYDDPNLLEALRFFSDLFNVHKVVAPNKNENFEDYNESQTLFNSGKAAMVTGELWEGATRTTMTDEQGFVFFPKGPKATKWQGSIENYVQFYIPANVKRAKEKAYIWEQIQMWDRVEPNNREESEKQLLADEQDIEVMLEAMKHAEPIFLPLGGALGDISYSIANRGESPETALERTKQIAQDAIDADLNKPADAAATQ
ncbi:ABC transporter substrate-binding protein [Paenibacillus harenae]|uniref:ABC transporter substrate-binding protein n=1 Tax=Paenibacillus harenae TaxID=306543 RepID=UPI0027910311|nr:extracellular solute-binding protein [Paenibacillus harenae]MDQ0059290.1 ABC-type glycerol-3-phosphate transport system substrate-binding protein [Paenibacillus harenae]